MPLHDARGQIEIPIRFEFRPGRVRWQAGEAEVLGWDVILREAERRALLAASPFPSLLVPKLPVGIRNPLSTKKATSFEENMVEVLVTPTGGGAAVHALIDVKDFPRGIVPRAATPANTRNLQAAKFPVLLAETRKLNDELLSLTLGSSSRLHNPQENPWELRDEFIALQRGDLKALQSFLDDWGNWSGLSASLGFGQSDTHRFRIVSPEAVWEFQATCRAALLDVDGAGWLATAPSLFSNSGTAAQSRCYVLYVTDCHAAIEKTITIDKLKNVKNVACARSGCTQIFSQAERRGTFCSDTCSGAVRQQRFRAKNSTSEVQ